MAVVVRVASTRPVIRPRAFDLDREREYAHVPDLMAVGVLVRERRRNGSMDDGRSRARSRRPPWPRAVTAPRPGRYKDESEEDEQRMGSPHEDLMCRVGTARHLILTPTARTVCEDATRR